MKKIRGRLSPSMLVAIVALVFAASGTAFAAGVIISDPSQLANGVVTIGKLASSSVNGTKILNGSVQQADQAHPVVRAQVNADGTLADASDVRRVVKLPLEGRYRLSFDKADFNGVTDLDQCAITANATQRSPFGGPVTADVTSVNGFDVTVLTTFATVLRLTSINDVVGGEDIDSGFDLIAAC
jgi:hypothetical protein